MIRPCRNDEFEQIYTIINDGALAYKGVIPEDCWSEPYMSRHELQHEIEAGVVFWGWEKDEELCGVMGLQNMKEVVLIRHAYVLSEQQRQGVGAALLSHLQSSATAPVLVGTWADARWAIRFYQKHGFSLVQPEEKKVLAKQYWTVPQRQMDVSVVLADAAWFQRSAKQKNK